VLGNVERQLHELGDDADHRPVSLGADRRLSQSTDQTAYPQTVLEKAWGSFQGGTSVTGGLLEQHEFSVSRYGPSQPQQSAESLVSTVTPFSNWANFNSAIWANGNQMVFSGTYNGAPGNRLLHRVRGHDRRTANRRGDEHGGSSSVGLRPAVQEQRSRRMNQVPNASNPATYRVYVRVSVCDPTPRHSAYLEVELHQVRQHLQARRADAEVCQPDALRRAGYLNGSGYYQQGGVLREPMGYIGPTYPQPLSSR
jgi:type IV pilus assembly protein PilY1